MKLFYHITAIINVVAICCYLACTSSTDEAKADGPPVPACVFDREPVAIFCTGQFGEKCFVCYKNNGNTECWPFERQRCHH